MTVEELYESAGKPARAIIKLSSETLVYTGKRRASKVTQFEAYVLKLRGGSIGYYINQNAHHAFYVPENVVEFIPVDTMELWYRARKAAEHIKADRIHGRELDGAFENNDGDEMAAALFRMAQKSKKLKEAIIKAWREDGFNYSFVKNAEKFSHLTNEELSKHAEQTRKNG